MISMELKTLKHHKKNNDSSNMWVFKCNTLTPDIKKRKYIKKVSQKLINNSLAGENCQNLS